MGVEIVFNHADYRLMSKRALEGLSEFREVNLFLRGIVPLIGYKSDIVTYERHERFAGESKYPLSGTIPRRNRFKMCIRDSSILENYMLKLTTDFSFASWQDAIEVYMLSLIHILCIKSRFPQNVWWE